MSAHDSTPNVTEMLEAAASLSEFNGRGDIDYDRGIVELIATWLTPGVDIEVARPLIGYAIEGVRNRGGGR
ncbi:hypothetical protein [Mycobacteroides abscessus]|uniref:hypothetical protein n=1 Tax=Mycobacteroides abscessus TaxID=36809 RepID=UPI0009A78911|nr:hypothetical protein [Mycobacteroides abscessus]MBN7317865.1 hypothetical protein [Mycobacteroides abscessus subsp. massiliense]QSM01844.1 hypothetical protein PROPHIGD79-1_55 [Mycobacterium phage prophi79-1]SLH42837.1 Uncharacterised protein [Mycobacteroides abscessus subsp. massiliense]